jgi:hypothetical protein
VRVLARVALAGALLVAVAVLALSLALPRIASSPTVRSDLADAATSALGYRVVFDELELRLFPPTFVMGRAQLFDPVDRDVDAFARAERIELTLALTPLLAGMVLIDSAVVEGGRLEVVRTDRGLQFPRSASLESDAINIMVRDVELRNAEVVLVDRSVVPPLIWELREVWAHVFGEVLDSRVRVELTGALASGGQLSVQGSWRLAGEVDLEMKFDAMAIHAAEPYFESGPPVEGLLTGSIRANGPLENLNVTVEATCREARFRLGEVALDGTLEVAARIDDAWAAAHGQIDLDATQAELTYAQFFTKPPGKAAHVTATLSHDSADALSIDAWKFVMQDLDARL